MRKIVLQIFIIGIFLFPVVSARAGFVPEFEPVWEEGGKAEISINSVEEKVPFLGKTYTEPFTGMEFVWIPGGCFQMGDTFGEGDTSEKPVHEVCVDGFYMGVYEVTFDQWFIVAKNNPVSFHCGNIGGQDNNPILSVSWNHTQKYISMLYQKTGKKMRLPTEAEWEYAAREGGRKVRFGMGMDTIGPYKANFDSRQKHKKSYSRSGEYRKDALPVGHFLPNSLGLFDMSGNVWEWCADWYDSDYYKNSPRRNPQGPESGSYRVVRGGGWDSKPWHLRLSCRYGGKPSRRSCHTGFRLVLTSI